VSHGGLEAIIATALDSSNTNMQHTAILGIGALCAQEKAVREMVGAYYFYTCIVALNLCRRKVYISTIVLFMYSVEFFCFVFFSDFE